MAVSTCYVAGNHRGAAPEAPVADSPYFVDVDWRDEVDAARRVRADAEAESRTPERLAHFAKEARRELGPAGGPLLAAKTETLRDRWVTDRMVEAGRSRAASLGWPDAYAYTKAHGECALLGQRGDLPVTIVRPSIIESALAEPAPGWIRGFRMAEPVIISYARGLLREFPGVPEGVVDVIPVDLVVAAIIDAAARGPALEADGTLAEPAIVQVASGAANPLRYRRLVELVQGWFGGPPRLRPQRSAHRRARVVLSRPGSGPGPARTGHEGPHPSREGPPEPAAAGRVRPSWPPGSRSAERKPSGRWATSTLYGAYTECEAIYGVDRLLDRHESLDAADRDEFCFDPRVIDWDHYVRDVHLPSVVKHARVRTEPGGKVTNRAKRLRGQVLSPDRHMAAFDLENTLIASNVVTSYAWLASRRLDRADRARLAAKLVAEAPALLAMDRRDRSDFLRHFYRRYEGAPVEQIEADSVEMLQRPDPGQGVSRGDPPGARAPPPRATAPC